MHNTQYSFAYIGKHGYNHRLCNLTEMVKVNTQLQLYYINVLAYFLNTPGGAPLKYF